MSLILQPLSQRTGVLHLLLKVDLKLSFRSYTRKMAKIGLIMCEDGEAWNGESGIAQYFIDRFNIVDNSHEYEVIHGVTGTLPKMKDLSNYTAFVISGSHYSVNDDFQWIRNLEKFILDTDRLSTNQRPKIFGICFAHQLIAKAFGGQVTQNHHKKFIFGSDNIILNKHLYEKEYFQQHLGKEATSFRIMHSHGEEVAKLPSNAVNVGKSSSCETEVLMYGDHIITTQGHPELEEYKMTEIILPRLTSNKQLNSQGAKQAIEAMKIADTDILVRFMLEFLTTKST